LVCEIKDNGKGMAENNLNKLYASKGIKLVKERIGLLQIKNSNPVKINSSNKEGTTIQITIQIDL
jgi:sensor histidine kinase YesM